MLHRFFFLIIQKLAANLTSPTFRTRFMQLVARLRFFGTVLCVYFTLTESLVTDAVSLFLYIGKI